MIMGPTAVLMLVQVPDQVADQVADQVLGQVLGHLRRNQWGSLTVLGRAPLARRLQMPKTRL